MCERKGRDADMCPHQMDCRKRCGDDTATCQNPPGKEKTFGELILELDNAIKPLGFKIKGVDREDWVYTEEPGKGKIDGKVKITVVRSGALG